MIVHGHFGVEGFFFRAEVDVRQPVIIAGDQRCAGRKTGQVVHEQQIAFQIDKPENNAGPRPSDATLQKRIGIALVAFKRQLADAALHHFQPQNAFPHTLGRNGNGRNAVSLLLVKFGKPFGRAINFTQREFFTFPRRKNRPQFILAEQGIAAENETLDQNPAFAGHGFRTGRGRLLKLGSRRFLAGRRQPLP